MFESLIHTDKELFITIHQFRNSFLDVIMPAFSNRWIWIPLYVFLAGIIYRYYSKKTFVILLAAGLMILLSDQSANLLKNNTHRARPCHDVELSSSNEIFTPAGCGGPYGFVSGHAANSFALSMFVFLLMRKSGRKKEMIFSLLFLWAAVVCWSRIYMGVHFPGDVICGAILGIICGSIAFVVLNKYYLSKQS